MVFLRYSTLKAGVSEEILNLLVLVLVLGLIFESFFFDLLASVSLANKMDAKVSTKTKTVLVQNLLRYISFQSFRQYSCDM